MIRNHHASASSAPTETAPAIAAPEGASAPIPLEQPGRRASAEQPEPEGVTAEVETWRPTEGDGATQTAYVAPYRLFAQDNGEWAVCWPDSFGRAFSVSGSVGPSSSSFPTLRAFARWQAISAALDDSANRTVLDAFAADDGEPPKPARGGAEWHSLRALLAVEEEANRYAWHRCAAPGVSVIEFDYVRIEASESGAWAVLIDGKLYDSAQCVPDEHATPEDKARLVATLAALEAIERGHAKARDGAAEGLRRVLDGQEHERKSRPLSWLKTQHGEGFAFNDVRVIAFESGSWEVSFVGDAEGEQVDQRPRGSSGAVLADGLGALSFSAVKAAALRACIAACEADGSYASTLPRLRELLAELQQFAPRADVEQALEERRGVCARLLSLAESETGFVGLRALADAFAEHRDDPATRERYARERAAFGPGGTMKAAADSISDAIAPLADLDAAAFASRDRAAIAAAAEGFTRLAARAMVARAAVLLDPTPAPAAEPAAALVEPEKSAEG